MKKLANILKTINNGIKIKSTTLAIVSDEDDDIIIRTLFSINQNAGYVDRRYTFEYLECNIDSEFFARRFVDIANRKIEKLEGAL